MAFAVQSEKEKEKQGQTAEEQGVQQLNSSPTNTVVSPGSPVNQPGQQAGPSASGQYTNFQKYTEANKGVGTPDIAGKLQQERQQKLGAFDQFNQKVQQTASQNTIKDDERNKFNDYMTRLSQTTADAKIGQGIDKSQVDNDNLFVKNQLARQYQGGRDVTDIEKSDFQDFTKNVQNQQERYKMAETDAGQRQLLDQDLGAGRSGGVKDLDFYLVNRNQGNQLKEVAKQGQDDIAKQFKQQEINNQMLADAYKSIGDFQNYIGNQGQAQMAAMLEKERIARELANKKEQDYFDMLSGKQVSGNKLYNSVQNPDGSFTQTENGFADPIRAAQRDADFRQQWQLYNAGWNNRKNDMIRNNTPGVIFDPRQLTMWDDAARASVGLSDRKDISQGAYNLDYNTLFNELAQALGQQDTVLQSQYIDPVSGQQKGYVQEAPQGGFFSGQAEFKADDGNNILRNYFNSAMAGAPSQTYKHTWDDRNWLGLGSSGWAIRNNPNYSPYIQREIDRFGAVSPEWEELARKYQTSERPTVPIFGGQKK